MTADETILASDWPYAIDGVERDEFAEGLRIPIIYTAYPRWCYITAVVVDEQLEDNPGRLWHGVRPTDDELRAIACYHEFSVRNYNESYRAVMRKRPFDIDGSFAGRRFIKFPHGGWAYRSSTWDVGGVFSPSLRDEPWSLMRLFDHIYLGFSRWEQWKADHAEVFALGRPSGMQIEWVEDKTSGPPVQYDLAEVPEDVRAWLEHKLRVEGEKGDPEGCPRPRGSDA